MRTFYSVVCSVHIVLAAVFACSSDPEVFKLAILSAIFAVVFAVREGNEAKS